MVKELQMIKKGNVDVVDSKLLHHALQVKSQHKDWIRRRIENYGFIKGTDYFIKQCSTLSGGSMRKDYLITSDMAKELSMLENSDIGKAVRKYFIRRDKELRHLECVRIAGIEVRKTLTDSIQESGENERMHGHGYSTFTRLAYKLTGLPKGERDSLPAEDLNRLEAVETIIKGLIDAGKQYNDIKEALLPIFKGE